ncbi:hypothetical protein C9I87_08750 [Photobacterium iliopiscarium]|uniref:putative phage abortive infection protein n=1 Tax=Photobacterium iliopiscarium TaxID=56192 RepID=UPI000D154A10|nr:putative phage abortive infection protein [Photobacterium iliopiscarium]PST95726.1 hypothetical protein C9I87_08750 [Photobacterium iliopiscarium]
MSTKEKEDDLKDLQKKIRFSTIIAIIIVTTVFSSYIGYLGIYKDLQISSDSGIWGTFGDFIGGLLNPIIAGLAFYWLTQSVLIQKKELSETQNVLKETENTQKKQRFENSFFALLEQMNSVYNKLDTQIASNKNHGNNYNIPNFTVIDRSILEELYISVFPYNRNTKDIEESYLTLQRNDSNISHYFRIIYQILKFILSNYDGNYNNGQSFDSLLSRPVTETEKFYSNIVRSFLSNEVTKLLAINCIDLDQNDIIYHLNRSDHLRLTNYKKFRALIERYAMLEHISDLNKMQKLTNYYDKTAFGNNKTAYLIRINSK